MTRPRKRPQSEYSQCQAYIPLPMHMANTIAAFSEMVTSQEIVCATKTQNGFAISLSSNEIVFLDEVCEIVSKHNSDEEIIALNDTDRGIFAVNVEGDIIIIKKHQIEKIFSGNGCKDASFSKDKFFILQESNELFLIDNAGESRFSTILNDPIIIHSSDQGDYVVVASEDGSLTILDDNLQVSHHSVPRDDDVEVISKISTDGLGKILVSRSSLGLVVDERAVNRIELWDFEEGLIGEAEVPSRITCITPYRDGYVAGCFEGEIILIKSNLQVSIISKMEYSISEILEWEGDIIASYWFFVERLSPLGRKIWSFEHQNLVKGLLKLENDGILIFGNSVSTNESNHITIIHPNTDPKEDDIIPSQDFDSIDLSNEGHSGMLTDNESSAALSRSTIDGIESLISDINEPIEDITHANEQANEDLLQSLSSTARSLNIPPVANAGEDITMVSNEDSKADVTLDGSGSYDPDGEIVAWSWSTGGGRKLGQSKIVRVRLVPGVHVFTLRVTDNMGAESESSMTVRII